MNLKIDSAPDGGDGALKVFLDRAFRTVELWAAQQQNPGFRTFSGLNLSNLQTDGYGLRIGDVFAEHGAGTAYYLRIVRSGEWYVRGVSASGAVGSVTVTP